MEPLAFQLQLPLEDFAGSRSKRIDTMSQDGELAIRPVLAKLRASVAEGLLRAADLIFCGLGECAFD